MPEIDLAYLPIIGRGEQINIICRMHGIKVNMLMSKPMGDDFDKDIEAPFGTVPWMKDHSNGLILNDSMAIVQYLVTKYPGPLTPKNVDNSALVSMYWAWCQDYYSFVLSPLHDIITGHNEPFWRNLYHLGYFGSLLGPFWSIWDHLGLSGVIWGPFWIILESL